MNRVSVVAAVIAAGFTGAAAASVAPAMASDAAASAHHAPAGTTSRPAKTTGGVNGATYHSISKATTAIEKAQLAAGQSSVPGLSTANIAAATGKGKYVTVVHCAGVDAPPPITVGQPGIALTVRGVDPPTQELKLLAKANAYKPVYACTVVVEMRAAALAKKASCEIAGGTASGASGRGRGGAAGCTKKVTLNTGFGGMAGAVSHHRPAS